MIRMFGKDMDRSLVKSYTANKNKGLTKKSI